LESGTGTSAAANNPKSREISLPGAMKWTHGVTISKYSDSLDQARRTFQHNSLQAKTKNINQ
jgi:hypothetical protein